MIPPREFIRKIHPFTFLSDDELDIVISGLEVELLHKNETIFKKGQTSEYVYVIFSGLIGLYDEEDAVDYLTKGEIFGISALYGNPMTLTARAIEDTVCYLIASRQFKSILDANKKFATFFRALLKKRFRSFKTIASDKKMLEEASFVLEVERIIYKKPVVCSPESTISYAAAEMDAHSVSSIVVIDNNARPVGILTHKDLTKVLVRGDKFDPITEFMSSPVKTIPAQGTIFDAFTSMIEAGIDHMVVMKDGRLFGVVTRKDIQVHLEPSFSIVKLFRKVTRADSLDEMKIVFDGLKVSVSRIVMTGANFFDLTKMLCSVHDAVIAKVINILVGGRDRDNFLWVHMGSSGRKEEIIATDQDNALIYAGDHPQSFAEKLNESLDSIGLPKCRGNYMASNSKWNQPLQVWKEYFRQWFADPSPVHLRYLSVFLDMRPIWGNYKLYHELIESVKQTVSADAITLMAEDAVDIKPPIGIFGLLGLHQGVDLKINGIYPIVNGARVLAVDSGIWGITNTRERLEALRDNRTISDEMCHDLIESYGFMQDLRLRHHARAVLNQSSEDNMVRAKEISKIDLLIFKESLKIVTEFQKFLMKRYNVTRTAFITPL